MIAKALKDKAVPFRFLELTPETWKQEFGDHLTVNTPIGQVKIGENQYSKLLAKDGGQFFALIKPTLMEPLYVGEKESPKEGAERNTKYIFIKSFLDKDKQVNFMSVTIQKEGQEIVISSHRKTLSGII
ncbi:MAG: hypothetical protein HQL03_04585 [Nitrospirae bacterium]|nr:hypothetical protein [Nitrospirota bacterium]MBF0590592.1 hypothetical protein [Nitrospirota bacterium]